MESRFVEIDENVEEESMKSLFKDLSVLSVDDTSENLELLKLHYSKMFKGFDVAVNGEEGFNKIKNNLYDIILMDLQMPVMDGISAVEEIRKYEDENKLDETPIIAVTAFAHQQEREKCEEAGFNYFYTKPIKKKALMKIMYGVYNSVVKTK